MKGTGENPSGVISVPLIVGGVRGWTKPHTLLRRIANTMMPRPSAESATPTVSSCGVLAARAARAICPRSSRMPMTTTVSPANTYRHDNSVVTHPPISGPAAIAIAAIPPSSAYASARSRPV